VDLLTDAGHEAAHVFDFDLAGHPDEDVWAVARGEGCVVVTNAALNGCIRGFQIPVTTVVGQLAAGRTHADLALTFT
jgi:predicted nuclease of predicted toxin-antitoxin system